MRIAAGIYGGRKLFTPEDRSVRPTSDKIRQALFNMLGSRCEMEEARVLDLFCGSGALGLEALSRGAGYALFVDNAPSSLALCKRNIELLGAQDNCRTLKADAAKLPGRPANEEPFSLFFMDPPYRKDLVIRALQSLREGGWLVQNVMGVIETEKGFSVAASLPEGFEIIAQRDYGDTQICIVRS